MLITNIDIEACVRVVVGIHFYSYNTYYARIVTVATKPFSFSVSDSSACVCVSLVWCDKCEAHNAEDEKTLNMV